MTDYGWFTGNAAGNDHSVIKGNAWGLYDIMDTFGVVYRYRQRIL